MKIIKIEDIPFTEMSYYPTGYKFLDSFFGGHGIVPCSTILINSAAGDGKTTFVTQLFQSIYEYSKENGDPYTLAIFSGEQNQNDFGRKAKWLNANDILFSEERYIENIRTMVEQNQLDFIALDSLPYLKTYQNLPNKSRTSYILQEIVNIAKQLNLVIFIINHLTKAGTYKGSSEVGHIFDILLSITNKQEETYNGISKVKYLTSTKNRYAATGEIYIRYKDGRFDFQDSECYHEAKLAEATEYNEIIETEEYLDEEG